MTVGGTISGYWEIGRVRIEMPPQMIISKAMVAAKIGLLMKKSSKVVVHGLVGRDQPLVEVVAFFLVSVFLVSVVDFPPLEELLLVEVDEVEPCSEANLEPDTIVTLSPAAS